MKKVRGYNFSRNFMGERVPQHVQNIVIKDFFDEDFLYEILKSLPDLSKGNSSYQWKNKNEVKFGNNDYSNFPNNINYFLIF